MEKSRNDIRILSELKMPSKGDNFDFRASQMIEVENLKNHLASDNLNVSTEIIQKAIVLPEEDQREEQI
jgi:hypothetical protein